ncbi:phage tail assembly protein [Pseudomonas viridiflava]|uniref:phage tail assembly protein n=1 Tax=Pseudomonas viridiflava TaxID=33069 RepID=UPI001F60BA92|nr:phage tail assembly protein [Pseudomonas viridiflava]MCI3908838.1 phage tail assembly protein [Pseudomonas viridiflava]
MTTTDEQAPTPAAAQDDNVIALDTPIKRGKTEILEISVRKPSSGELRGIQLAELIQLDVASLIKVIPRLSNPALTAPEVANLDPADLLAIGSKVVGFLLQKSAKADASLAA